VKVLDALTAEINTATVSVRMLQISNKQVTLAVFRQLIEDHIVEFNSGGANDDDSGADGRYHHDFDFGNARLRGVAWGHVRYLVDNPKDINLVWQLGDELRRCIVHPKAWWRYTRPAPCRVEWENPRASNDFVEGHCGRTSWGYNRECLDLATEESRKQISSFFGTVAPVSPSYIADAVTKATYKNACAALEAQEAQREPQRKKLRQDWEAKCLAPRMAAWRANEATADRYEKLVAGLFAKPQLFIAV
jgi:hypothetical protein